MRSLLLLLTIALLASGAPAPAQVLCGAGQATGPGLSSAWRGVEGGGKVMSQYSAASFDNLVEGATREVQFLTCSPAAVLDRVLLFSTNCLNCDVQITAATGAGGTRTIYWNDAIPSETVDGTLYQTRLNAVLGEAVIMDVDASTTYGVYVRIVNSDAEATNDEDVAVVLYWRSIGG